MSSRRRHTRCGRDWSSDVCSSDLEFRGSRLTGHSKFPHHEASTLHKNHIAYSPYNQFCNCGLLRGRKVWVAFFNSILNGFNLSIVERLTGNRSTTSEQSNDNGR